MDAPETAGLDIALRRTFDEAPGVVSAYLFGSVAHGRAHRESDLDVGVLLDWVAYPGARDRFEARLRLTAQLGAATRRNDVDLVILNDAPPHLARNRHHRTACLLRQLGSGSRLRPDHNAPRRRSRAISTPRTPREAARAEAMTYLVERLAELRRHLDHLRALAPRVPDRSALEGDLSLHNDVLFSLLMVSQLVIDIAGELSVRQGHRFEDYTEAIRNLARDGRFPDDLVGELVRLPGFRNVVIHEYVALDLDRVVEAVNRLEPIERFAEVVRRMESGAE